MFSDRSDCVDTFGANGTNDDGAVFILVSILADSIFRH
jgi:hypothetical protein